MSRGNTGPLLVNEPQTHEQPDAPAWVSGVIRKASVISHSTVQLLAVVLLGGVYAGVVYGSADATVAAGYVHTIPCGFRASLFILVSAVMNWIDFVGMLIIMCDKDLPSAWDQTKQAAHAMSKSLSEALPVFMVAFTISMGPVIVWLWAGISHFVYAICLQILGMAMNITLATFTYSFWSAHCEMSQAKLTKRVVTGELSYETAVTEYAVVNKERKALSRGLGKMQCSFGLYLLLMAVVVYDWEIRPWGGWHFALIYCLYALTLVLQLSPWFALHDWPDEFCREMMESAELAWSPSDRSNFATLVTTTKVRIALFDFEMTPGLRTGLPLVFFGWFLYITELKQFHGFTGLPFDQMCFNASVADEGGGHHH